MRLASLLHSPGPPHAFALEGGRIVYGRLSRSRDRLVAVRPRALPHGWFELGPVGVLHVDRATLEGALAGLVAELEKVPARASLVVPNCWVRSLVVEVGELPRNRAEAEELLRWKLKKLLPCRPEEARLDFVPLPDNGRVWTVLGLEKPLAVTEEVFAGRGIAVGRLEPVALTLLSLLPPDPAPQLLLSLDPRTFAAILVGNGAVRLVRHKLLPGAGAAAEAAVLRELAATLAYVRERQNPAGPLTVLVATDVETLRSSVLQWAEAQEGVEVRPLTVRDPRLGEGGEVEPVTAWALLAAGMRVDA